MNSKLGYKIDEHGEWNEATIDINDVGLHIYAKPNVAGACIGILDIDGVIYFLSEDDDHYVDKCVLTHHELETLWIRLDNLASNIKGAGYDLYLPDSYTSKYPILKSINPGQYSDPSIVRVELKKGCTYDIHLFWIKGWVEVIKKALSLL